MEIGQGYGAGPTAIAASGVTVVSPTEITAVTGGGAKLGTFSVYVFTSGAISGANTSANFTYKGATPTVSAVSPSSGSKAGGTAITITGTNFVSGAKVEIGQGSGGGPTAIAATSVTVVSPTEITAVTGGGAKLGTFSVYVSTTGGTSAASSGSNFTYNSAAPTVSAVSPNSGPTAGGTAITITGTNFVSGAKVEIGQGSGAGPTAIAATSVTVVSPTEITAVTGGRAKPGTFNLYVTTTTGGVSTASSADNFTYVRTPVPTVSAVSPNSGPGTGGTPITITGTGFVSGATVSIGQGGGAPTGITATDVVVVSPTEITAVTGGRAVPGTWNLYVVQGGHSSAANSSDDFTYNPMFTVSAMSPSSGPMAGGTPITITGTGFVSGVKVVIGQGSGPWSDFVAATDVTVVSPTTITAVTGAANRAGTLNLFVTTTAGGLSTVSSADHYTYVRPPDPTVSAVSPNSGPGTGGTPITITGTGFVSGATVSIGQGYGAGRGVTATDVVVVSPTEITAVTEGRAVPGTWNLYVVQGGRSSRANSGDDFTYNPMFTVSAVSPNSGPLAGGTPITITGTGFVSGVKVVIGQGSGPFSGAIAATDVVVVSPTKITAVTGAANRGGTLNLFVTTTAGGLSTVSSADHFTYK